MAELIGICPKCHGNLYDDHGAIACLQCGLEINNKTTRSQYYEANKGAIMSSYRQDGRTKTLKRFRIPAGSISRMLRVWQLENGQKPVPVPEKVLGTEFPDLPIFSNDWTDAVQIKWLEIWAERSK